MEMQAAFARDEFSDFSEVSEEEEDEFANMTAKEKYEIRLREKAKLRKKKGLTYREIFEQEKIAEYNKR